MARVHCTLKASALSLVLAAVACGPSSPAKSEPKDVVPTNVQASAGMKLVTACTPTGPELCFNAVDDNCNGAIDEGCGVCTGDLQFTIAWGDSPANVDLIVVDPTGKVDASAQSHNTPGGLTLDHDCPSDKNPCNGQNIENVCRSGGDPPKGHYKVTVKLVDLAGATSPVLIRYGARVGSRSFGADISLAKPGDHQDMQYDVD